ncbi:class I adenylate-forming enzyme family protein [Lysinibacillus agricola]|uniref:class I adenylate-forming enzyme family protein n=1 Tax=Lysinibacillus agricola TaxID=2590012 RepID=UPI003C23B7BF
MIMKNMIKNVVMEYGTKTATVFEEVERTYQQFYNRINKVSNSLINLMIKKGDRVVLLLNNRPEYFELYFGIFGFGGIAVPLNTRLAPTELIYIINHSGANTLIYEDVFKEKIATIINDLPEVKNFVSVGEKDEKSLNYEEMLQDAESTEIDCDVVEDDIAFLCYTSGTTGRPKGVMITHKNMTQMCSYQLIELPRFRHYIGMCLFPFFHIGVMMGLNKIAMGMTCVFANFSTERIAKVIEQYKVNDLDITATQLKIFSNDPVIQEYDLTSLKTVSTGGGFSSADTLRKFFERFEEDDDVVVANIYGMTENTAHVMSNIISRKTLGKEIKKMDLLPGIKASGLGAGKPIYGMLVKLVDNNGNQVPENEAGELIVKGDTVMKGYWQEPDKTAEAVIDGWYYTGDIGVRLETGEYFVVDRKKDMIVSGDENIYSAEVENVLATHPEIEEVAMIGLPHEVYGEVAIAIVVLKEESSVNDQELQDFCRGKLAGYKIPKQVHFAQQLPRNASGKILKHRLKATYSE